MYSWDQLLITKELFQKLLTILKVHPGFLDVVNVFGEKITAVEESFAASFTSFYPEPSVSRGCGYGTIYRRVQEHFTESVQRLRTISNMSPDMDETFL